MVTAFSSDEFIKIELINGFGEKILVWLKNDTATFNSDFLTNNSTGFLSGFMVEPPKKPNWMIPGVILSGLVLGIPCTLTLEPSFTLPIAGVDEEIGEKVRFSFVVSTEYQDVRL